MSSESRPVSLSIGRSKLSIEPRSNISGRTVVGFDGDEWRRDEDDDLVSVIVSYSSASCMLSSRRSVSASSIWACELSAVPCEGELTTLLGRIDPKGIESA